MSESKLLDKLNPMQRAAAQSTEGPLLILAGAGSGKTSTLTHRIAHLILDKGVDAGSILAVTFTNKAAGEMRERVEKLVGGHLDTRAWSQTAIWLLTFHSAALRILKAHAKLLGYSENFAIYDPQDQKAVIKRCVKELGLDEKKWMPAYVLSEISASKGGGESAEEYKARSGSHPVYSRLAELYEEYERVLRKNQAMDFDDLLLNAVKLFETQEEVLEEYRRRFRYIMVDEYQDTNYLQYRIVSLLAAKHRNICVVGDEDQCIYRWRGADIRNILDFEKDFTDAKTVKLEQNYRSTGNILAAANSMIVRNTARKGKKLWTDAEAGELVSVLEAQGEKEEARLVAMKIEDGLAQGRELRDFAVLYRTNVQSRNFEEIFSAMGVPYQVVGGLRYYERKEIKDMISYLRLICEPSDDMAFLRIINEPRRGVGPKTLEKLGAMARAKGLSLFAILESEDVLMQLSPALRDQMRRFVKFVDTLSCEARAKTRSVCEIYEEVMIRSGYMGALEARGDLEADSRIENLLEFKSLILEKEHEGEALSLTDFLDQLALISDIDNHDPEEDAVTLMTLHSAKGLEFPVVFMPGMEEGLFPSSRSLGEEDGLEDERRLCYVGMTRAREKLYMLRTQSRTVYGRTERSFESRFLREIDKKYLDGAELVRKETTGFLHRPMGAEYGYGAAHAINPLAGLRKIKEEVLSRNEHPDDYYEEAPDIDILPTGMPISRIRKGDRVEHSNFGSGIVVEKSDKTIGVIFDSVGKKTLVPEKAPMRIIG